VSIPLINMAMLMYLVLGDCWLLLLCMDLLLLPIDTQTHCC